MAAGTGEVFQFMEGLTDRQEAFAVRDRLYERLTITGIRGLTEAQQASLRALGAFEETSVGG